MENINLVIFGSRTIYNLHAKQIILNEVEKIKPKTIITAGEATGICRIAREIAQQLSIPLKLFWLNKKYAQGQYEHRSKEALENCNLLLVLHDGFSKGTKNELVIAKKLKIPIIYNKINNDNAILEEIKLVEEN